LQNNLDIIVQRYNPWLADTSILKAEAGGLVEELRARRSPARRPIHRLLISIDIDVNLQASMIETSL